MPRLRKKLAVTAVACVASLLACEVIVRLVADVAVAPFLRDYDPDLDVRYKPNLKATIEYPEFSMQWSTNSRGFRGPEPPPSTDGCVLVLGDSFSEGWGVNDGEEYPSLLRQALDDRYGPGVVPVINAAMSKSGNGRWIKLLRGDLADCRPRLVLFQACWNDPIENAVEDAFSVIRVRSHPDSLGTTTELAERVGNPKPFSRSIQPLLEVIPGLQSSHLFALVRSIPRNDGSVQWRLEEEEPDGYVRRKNAEITGQPWVFHGDYLMFGLVEHSLALCRLRSWPTALMTVRIGGTRLEELHRICRRFDTPLLDVRNRVEHPELYYEVDGHWNAAGHRVIADRILKELLAPDSDCLSGLEPLEKQ